MINKVFKYSLILTLTLIFLPGSFLKCLGQTEKTELKQTIFKADQTNLKVSTVPSEKIVEYRNDPDFNYLYAKAEGNSFWDLIRYWFGKFLEKLFSDQGVAPYIRYLLIFLLIAFITYKIAGGNLSGIFRSNKKIKGTNGFDYFEEDIHQLDIDKKLNDAIREKNYRDAIRYYYLILLKKLDAGELIEWELGKTNTDYQKELKASLILDDFINLSGVYEYSWYGHFEVNESKFANWQNRFLKLFGNID